MSPSRMLTRSVSYKRTDAPEVNGSANREMMVNVEANPPVAVCPCLGTVEDAATALAFTSPGNRCYRAGQPMSVPLSHQQPHCLAASHTSCPVFRSHAQRPPGHKSKLATSSYRRPVIVHVARLSLLLLAGMAILIAFLWLRPALPVSEGLEQESNQLFLPVVQAPLLPVQPTAVLTESLNSTPVPSPTMFVVDAANPAAVSEPTPLPTNTAVLETPAAVSVTPSSSSCSLPVNWQAYTIQRGDTLYSLARQRGTNATAVKEANCLPENLIITGQRIFLPDIVPVASPEPGLEDTPQPETIRVNATD